MGLLDLRHQRDHASLTVSVGCQEFGYSCTFLWTEHAEVW